MSIAPSEPPTGVGLGLRWAFLDEVAEGAVSAALRFFEISPENYMRRGGCIPAALEAVAERYPLLSHGLMMNVGGTTPLDPGGHLGGHPGGYLGELRAFLRAMHVPWHSDHLCWTGSDGAILHDLLPLPHDVRAVDRCVDRIARIQDAIGLPFAVENISYYLVPAGGMSELEFLHEVLRRADCQLLLDVNNVQVNADNLGFDAAAFIDALPLHRVVQLHVAGGQRRPHLDGLVIDTHGTDVSPRVQALMARVVERIGPVPVIYERDHDIPPLPELVRQVEALQGVYEVALARHRERTASATDGAHALDRADAPATTTAAEIASLPGVLRGMSRIILDRTGEQSLRADPEGWLRRQGVEPPDERALASVGAPRLLVYRSLVRAGLRSVIEAFVPRTVARLGEPVFERTFEAWLHQSPPRSRYYRDVPGEFVQWGLTTWPKDPEVDDVVVDLARLEILESEVDAAPDPPPPPDLVRELVLDRPLCFGGALRMASFDHAIHELADDPLPRNAGDRVVVPRQPTVLLLHRDAEHRVRTLTLSPLAEAVLRRLWTEGQTVAQAVPEAAAEVGETVDDALLARISGLLTDLAERGVLRGCLPGDRAPELA
ncbi:multinuclear nonheme iron-dependent oxidase [Paraliomyxa miuraensis]|uniref:multinuclear nonheme iron-dependent oxidase n=1 Tax=Paraliomyxa miuraensis TaxID=376150 RepID=UPI00225A849E|nr:DUF692 family multinuclear iron-containing protein [Paraliomyxa miuraensis]MCX4245637.1 DUF692 family protein [Paraliomyxa miuraensis]